MDLSDYEHLLQARFISIDLFYYFALVFLHFVAEPSRWKLYLSPSIYSLGLLMRIFSFTALATYVLPLKLGLPLRLWLLRAKAGLGFPQISSLMLLDGLLYYGMWGVSVVLTMPGMGHFSPNAQLRVHTWAVLVASVVVLTLFAGYTLLRNGSFTAQSPSQIKSRWILRAREGVRKLDEQYRTLGAGPVLMAALVCVLDISSHVFRHWVLLELLGQSLPLQVIAAITCASLFAGLVSMMPMGLGGYDIVLVLLLTQQAGIPSEIAIAAPILNRMGNIAMSGMLGVWGAWGLGINPFDRERLTKRLRAQ